MKNKVLLCVMALVVLTGCAGVGGYFYSDYQHSRKQMEELKEAAFESATAATEEVTTEATAETSIETANMEASEEVTAEATAQESVAAALASTAKEVTTGNPVDIAKLQNTNPDIFAWISVPGTVIDYPIAQHPTDDMYYLKHGPDGITSSYGCPFIESCDSKAMDDFNTVVYGHNMNDGSMFAGLHKFEDKDFFDKHRLVYVYTAEHVFSYEIFAAVMYSDIRIPYYYDDAKESDRTAFIDSLKKDIVPERSIVSEDISVTAANKIITLSTCDKKLRDNRFIVTAVLKQIDGQDVG